MYTLAFFARGWWYALLMYKYIQIPFSFYTSPLISSYSYSVVPHTSLPHLWPMQSLALGVFLDNNLSFITLKCIKFLFWLMSSVIVKKYFFSAQRKKIYHPSSKSFVSITYISPTQAQVRFHASIERGIESCPLQTSYGKLRVAGRRENRLLQARARQLVI